MRETFKTYVERAEVTVAVCLHKDTLDGFRSRADVKKTTTITEGDVTTYTFEWDEDFERNPLVVKAGDYIIETLSPDRTLGYYHRRQYQVVSETDFYRRYVRDEFPFTDEEIRQLKKTVEALLARAAQN